MDTQLRAWGLTTGNLAPALAAAYEQSDLFSEHTFGPWGPNGGSWNSGTPRYLYGDAWKAAHQRGAYKKYEEAFDDKRAFAHKAEEIVQRELSQRLELLAASVKGEGQRVVVYNALPWERSGVVETPRPAGQVHLLPRAWPAGGYKTYSADQSALADKSGQPAANTLDTPFYQVVFDLKRGGIASLVDKKTGRDLVDKSSPYALGQFLHERFDNQHMRAFHDAYGRPGYSWWKGDLPKDEGLCRVDPAGMESHGSAYRRDRHCDPNRNRHPRFGQRHSPGHDVPAPAALCGCRVARDRQDTRPEARRGLALFPVRCGPAAISIGPAGAARLTRPRTSWRAPTAITSASAPV